MKHKRSRYVIPAHTPEEVRRMQELRRSGAAGKHRDKRDRRARTRGASKARALKDFA